MVALMKKICLFLSAFILSYPLFAQDLEILTKAKDFIHTLNKHQQLQAIYPFQSDERFNFHFFPIQDRKGISLNELDAAQKKAAFALLRTCLSAQAYRKAQEII